MLASHSPKPLATTAAAAIARFVVFLSCSTPRATQAAHRSSDVLASTLSAPVISVCMTHAGAFLNLRLFKSEQPSPVGFPTIARVESTLSIQRDVLGLKRRAILGNHVPRLLDWLDRHGTAP